MEELEGMELNLLGENKPVRMLGTVTEEEGRHFHPCAIFPLKAPNELSMRDMREDRDKFAKKMHDFEERIEKRGQKVLKMEEEESELEEPCEKLPLLKK
jgi:hypothetical protein